jgi:hypothetical protein
MSCTSNVATIAEFCGQNAPGLTRSLHITTLAKVASIGAPTAHVVATITMVATMLFYKWGFSKNENSYESVQDENGLWTTTVRIFIDKLEATKTNVLVGMLGDNYIAVVEDKNGNARLIGGVDEGCTVRVRETTSPRNGYEVTITWESALAPYFFTGTVTT